MRNVILVLSHSYLLNVIVVNECAFMLFVMHTYVHIDQVPGVFVDALDGRRARGHPLHQSRVPVGEDGFAGDPVGVDVQSCGAQPEAASLVRQRAAMACGPREGLHT